MTVPLVRVCLCHRAPVHERERDDAVLCRYTHQALECWSSAPAQAATIGCRIADNPNRVKWCTGACGRPLKVTEFYDNGDGYPQAVCKACRRAITQKYLHKRWRKDREFRARGLAKAAAIYWADPEKYRARQRARYRARRAA